ncbi:porin [Piscinibacter sakaiensis]|nr:porin [Piscinibacter sakaiensis]
MKRTIFVAAIATLAAGSALAQSSVTVYGRLNVTAERFTANKQTTYLLNNNASRIGFKGVEDLGGGLQASFLMESGFSPDTGAASATFWGRESWVAIGGAFGKVRLGNMGRTNAYFTTADYISMHNHDTGTSEDKLYLYPGRATNMIAYTSPSLSGLVVDAQLSLSETSQAGRTYVLTANYDQGPLHLGGSYLQAGAGRPGAKEKEYGLRALYELGDFTVGAYYIRNDNVFGNNGWKRNAVRVSAMYTMGPGELHVNVGKAYAIKGNAITGDDALQATVGYNYNLSKRTKVYTYYTRVTDDARLYTGKYGTLAAGIRHNF